MKNIEPPSKEHLASIIHNLGKGAYVIPDFQREFEWSARDVQDLLRSIFEDYYIGTLLLWRATKHNLEFLQCEPIYGYGKTVKPPEHIILDGQQRLSALYYSLFAPNKNFPRRKLRYLFFIDLTQLLAENYDDAFFYRYGNDAAALIADKENLFSNKYFPLQVLGESPHAWLQWLNAYEKYWNKRDPDTIAPEKQKLENMFGELLNSYYISFIELDREMPVAKVCDIFTRINNTGIDLDIFDLLNALLRPRDVNLKKEWRSNVGRFNLPDPDKGKIFVLQTMSILKQEYCAPKFLYYLVPQAKKKIREKEDGSFRDIVLIDSSNEFKELWKSSLEENLDTLKMINNPKDLGAIVVKFMPYPTMLPIFTALNIEKRKAVYTAKKTIEDKIRAWYWSSIFSTNYSSSVETQMAQDLREMRNWFLDDGKVPQVLTEMKNSLNSLDLIKHTSSGSAIYKGVFCMIVRRGAKDFHSWELPEYSELDDHHIVPQSWGRKNAPDFIDSIVNRTPISDATNRHVISNDLPNVYIADMIKKNGKDAVYSLFASHLVPKEAVNVLLRPNFKTSDFEEFLKIRGATIRDEIKSLCLGV